MKSKFNYNKDVVKDNIEGVLQQSTLSIYKEGKEWYPKAHQYAVDFAKTYNKPRQITAGIIACLSPQKSWWHNLILADDFLKCGGTDCRHTGQQVEKAKAIYQIDPDSEGKCKQITKILGGLKTQNFFWNIYFPTAPEYVTIDFHMLQLTTGRFECKDCTDKQYAFLKECIIEVANDMNLIPQELQSVLWLTWKNIKPKRIK